MQEQVVAELRCQRCGERWRPRVADPVRCPRCQSVNWDAPRANGG